MTQPPTTHHPWFGVGSPEPRVPALLFIEQSIKKIYILSTWIKLVAFLLEVLFLVEFIISLTFACHLACMDRISKLDSPFYLTFTHLLACMGRNDEPCRQACKLHLLRKHNLARRCLEPHPMHSIVSSKLIRGIRRIHPRT